MTRTEPPGVRRGGGSTGGREPMMRDVVAQLVPTQAPRLGAPVLGPESRSWLRTAAPFIGVSALLVATSLAVLLVAYRLQLADPLSGPVPALRWFDVNSERNVPTAWSVLLLLSAAVTAALLALRTRRTGTAAGWLLVAAVVGFLALDESLELHERLNSLGGAVVDDRLHFAWVVPGGLAAVVVGLVLLRQLHAQPALVRRRLVVSGAVYLTGALLLEALSGQVLRAFGGGRAYVVVTSCEEGLEMAGASLLLAALLCELRRVRRSRAATAAAPV